MFIGFKPEATALNNLRLVPDGSLGRGAMSGCGPERRLLRDSNVREQVGNGWRTLKTSLMTRSRHQRQIYYDA